MKPIIANAELPQQTDTSTIDRFFQQAIAHHQAGQLQDAERLYHAILQIKPNHSEAHHNLGVLALQMKQPAAGLAHFMAALESEPTRGQFWLSYIDALLQADQFEAARDVLALAQQQGLQGHEVEALAIRLNGGTQVVAQSNTENQLAFKESPPVSAAVLQNSKNKSKKKQAKSNKSAKNHVQNKENSPSHHEMNTLIALFTEGRLTEAESLAQTMTVRFPLHGFGWHILGAVFKQMGRNVDALALMQKAAALLPNYADAHSNLCVALRDFGRLDEAEASCRRALQINPNFAEAHCNLGIILHDLGRLDEAEASYRKAKEINPDYALAHSNLGVALQDLGRLNESEANYRQALEINPNDLNVRSNLLFLLNYSTDTLPSHALAEARRYGQIVEHKIVSQFAKWSCEKQPERLRVGFVSGDLRDHPVGYFLENLLTKLDPTSVELIAYPTNHKADELTARIKPCFSAWNPIFGLNDESAARLIHNDSIHVLIDLSGHSLYNRLPVFAWKPAPVQVSWLGYLSTTGVAAIDYLIADPWTLPASEEAYFSEKIQRLPETYLCFTPPDIDIQISALPAINNGYITFGSFNNLTKMNDDVVALWSRVLASVPDSRLFLKTKQLKETSVRQSIVERFATHGIDSWRLTMEGTVPNRAEHLAAYHRVDIALDTFPYTGITTSVEGLWMGVPLLTLAGKRFLSRQGIGLLMNAGLPEWIASDADDYVARAVSHARDLQSLATLRNGLRQQLLASPLFNAPRFAKHFEEAIWNMWEQTTDRVGDGTIQPLYKKIDIPNDY